MIRVVVAADDSATARLLRDAGHEVIAISYAFGPDRVAAIAVQEDADAVVVATDPASYAAALAAVAAHDVRVLQCGPHLLAAIVDLIA